MTARQIELRKCFANGSRSGNYYMSVRCCHVHLWRDRDFVTECFNAAAKKLSVAIGVNLIASLQVVTVSQT